MIQSDMGCKSIQPNLLNQFDQIEYNQSIPIKSIKPNRTHQIIANIANNKNNTENINLRIYEFKGKLLSSSLSAGSHLYPGQFKFV